MRLAFVLIASFLAAPAMATLLPRHPAGAHVHGSTSLAAAQKNAAAQGTGERNEARNSVGVIRAGTQIQGNTNITASQSDATAIASGSGNTAANEVGVIGGR